MGCTPSKGAREGGSSRPKQASAAHTTSGAPGQQTAIRGATSGHKLGSTAGNSAVNAEERRAQMLAAAEGRQQESLQKGISAKGAAKLHEYQTARHTAADGLSAAEAARKDELVAGWRS